MKNIIISTTLAIFVIHLSGCMEYAQLFNVSSIDGTTKYDADSFLVYENDTLKIVYSLWAQGGEMSFFIQNKYNKPIYVDWKKCSFIFNGSKNNYYEDKSVSDFVEVGASYRDVFKVNRATQKGVSMSVNEERVAFLPPGAAIRKTSYTIFDRNIIPSNYKQMKRDMNNNGVYTYEVDKMKAKIKFRNYITYSTTENFDKEQYIDNGFYVSSVNTINSGDFSHTDANGHIHYIEYRPDRFYIQHIKESNLNKR